MSDDRYKSAMAFLESIADEHDYRHGSTWHRPIDVFGSDLGSAADAVDVIRECIAEREKWERKARIIATRYCDAINVTYQDGTRIHVDGVIAWAESQM